MPVNASNMPVNKCLTLNAFHFLGIQIVVSRKYFSVAKRMDITAITFFLNHHLS